MAYIMWCVILQPKGTSRNAVIPEAQRVGGPDASLAGSILRRATAPQSIGTWKWGKVTIHLFAYKTGKAGTENKHELPPPHDTILLFGDALLFATTDGKLTTFNTESYTKFYNEALGGFEDLESEDEDDDIDSDVEEDDEEEEDEEEVESDEPVEDEVEEEEEAPILAKVVKPTKRLNKKIPIWYNSPALETEAYTLVRSDVISHG